LCGLLEKVTLINLKSHHPGHFWYKTLKKLVLEGKCLKTSRAFENDTLTNNEKHGVKGPKKGLLMVQPCILDIFSMIEPY